jgi:1,4-dihydroxy-2-naphthoate octaprenyltransferase
MMDRTGRQPGDPGRGRLLGAFFELGKLRIVELWLGFFVGVSLLGRRVAYDGRAPAILGLVLLLGVAVIAVTCGLDDIRGARDGVDRANHRDGRRWGVDKPILSGKLTEPEALDLVCIAGAIGLACLAAVLVLAWPLPAWVVAATVAMVLVPPNYSYGLKLSYLGLGELVAFTGGFGTVMIPYTLVAGEASSAVVVSSALVGAWHAQVVMCSNSHDAEGDRAMGRSTIAACLSTRGNRIYIASTFVACWALTGVAFASGAAPIHYLPVLLPVWAMQAFQLWIGVRHGQWLRARLLGFRVLRLGVFALTLSNIAMG